MLFIISMTEIATYFPIYNRQEMIKTAHLRIIPENSKFNIDTGIDSKKRFGGSHHRDWKKKETMYRPQVQLNNRSESAWVPNRLKMDIDKVKRMNNQIKSLLNKITETNYEKIINEITNLEIEDAYCLNTIVVEIHKKAVREPTFSKIYAKMCLELGTTLKKFDEINVDFKRLIISHCQNKFSERGDLKGEDDYEKNINKKEILGNAKLIGEFYLLNMINGDVIINKCLNTLLTETPSELNMEIFNQIITVCCSKILYEKNGQNILNSMVDSSREKTSQNQLGSRIKFMIMNLNDLRKKNWQK